MVVRRLTVAEEIRLKSAVMELIRETPPLRMAWYRSHIISPTLPTLSRV